MHGLICRRAVTCLCWFTDERRKSELVSRRWHERTSCSTSEWHTAWGGLINKLMRSVQHPEFKGVIIVADKQNKANASSGWNPGLKHMLL